LYTTGSNRLIEQSHQTTNQRTLACRLILSGTPIQNSVLELWSLFDFLMPGLLGSERAFNTRFGKAVRAGARAATTKRGGGGGASAEAEAGLLAAAALHRAVQPFILRRTKAQVWFQRDV
jgi:TATA-binding protein-associated factor